MDDITRKLYQKFKKAYHQDDVENLKTLAQEIAVRIEHAGRVGEYNELLFKILDDLLDAGEFETALKIGRRFLNPEVYEDAKMLTEINILAGDLINGIEIIYPHLDIVREDPDFKGIIDILDKIESGEDNLNGDELENFEDDPLAAHILLIFQQLGFDLGRLLKSFPYVFETLSRATNGFRGNKDSWAAAFVYFFSGIAGDEHIPASRISEITGIPPSEIYRKSRILYNRYMEEDLL